MLDTRTGRVRAYSNPDRTAARPVQDTSAFACTGGDTAPHGRPAAGGEAPDGPAVDTFAPPSIVPPPSPQATCASSSTAVCIDGRFLLEVRYRAGGGRSGPGQAIPLQSLGVAQGGLFWFFSADNPEMLIKVLDGCGVNEHFWVFYAAGTNVGFTVTVTDTQTARQKTYVNINGTAAPPVQDVSALPCP